MYDILLKNGTIIDGTGEKPYQADVAIEDGKIAAIAPGISEGLARETVDVSGLCVTPGFIDIHSHSDLSFIEDERGEAKLYQGVTSELSGQCGSSPFPCPPGQEGRIASYGDTNKGNFAACSLEAFLAGVQARGNKMGTNLMPLVGHGVLRCGVLGFENRKPTDAEMKQMRELLAADMATGAWGMSLGLGYTPGLSADTHELCLLGEEVAPHDGIITSHMRNQGTGTPQSLEEMFAINRHSGAHVHIAHFKASGRASHGRAPEFVQIVRDGKASGVNVTVDLYPYTASSSGITNSFPKWSIEGGKQRAVEILNGPERQKLMSELEKSFDTPEQGKALVVVSTHGKLPEVDGKNLYEISQMWGVSQAEAAARVAVETNTDCSCISFGMAEEDVLYMLSQNDFSIGSDGSAIPLDPALNEGKPHPRNFGTFPRVLRIAREQKLCPPEVAIRRITGLSADSIGVRDRGYLRPGMVADITVLNMDTVADKATYQDPFQKPEGIIHVLMDGQFALRNGAQTEKRMGKILLKK